MNEHMRQGEPPNYAMKLRQEDPERMTEMENQVRHFITLGKKNGLLLENESLNDKEVALVANGVVNQLHRKRTENNTEDVGGVIQDALLGTIGERLNMKKEGLRDPTI